MLHDKQYSRDQTFEVDTKVSMHTLHAFPGLIT